MALNLKRKPLPTSVDPIFGEHIDPTEMPYIKFSEMRPFHKHPFHLYSGQRLQDMIDSITEHGILNPPILLELPEPEGEIRYEILAGHNRINAARLAGYKEAQCIIKKDLTEDEALTYVVETNLMQRSFAEMLPSEQAAALSTQYNSMVSQGKRSDILNELRRLEGKEPSSENNTRSDAALGAEYSLSGSTVARLLRIAQLTPDLQRRVDDKGIDITAAVQLSYLSPEQQTAVELALAADPVKIDLKKAKQLRTLHNDGKLTNDRIQTVLSGVSRAAKESRGKLPDLKIKPKIYSKYFAADTSPEDMLAEIEKALSAYFSVK